MKMKIASIGLLMLSWIPSLASALSAADESVASLQREWAIVNYQKEGKEQLAAYLTLIDYAHKSVEQHPDDVAVLVWRGIIQSSYAGAKGGLGALAYAKSAKIDFERAIARNPEVLDGSAYTSLGILYLNVPGWPIAFGDDGKAEVLLEKALALNPKGIDTNFFYADFLINEKRYDEAELHLAIALNAPHREGRALADQGRRQEIRAAMASIKDQ